MSSLALPTRSLHDALPILDVPADQVHVQLEAETGQAAEDAAGQNHLLDAAVVVAHRLGQAVHRHGRQRVDARVADRKSTRLNSSHLVTSYAVYCLENNKSR